MADSTLWSDLLGGAGQLYGYSELLDRLEGQKEGLNEFFSGTRNDITTGGTFNPATVRGPWGTTSGGDLTLGQDLADMSLGFRGAGQDAMMGAVGSQADREQAIYDRMRATMMPEEQRAQQQMQSSLLNRGRSGITTNAYGGTSEQHALHKAIGENQNNAMLGAMTQAQNEAMNQFKMGQGLMGQSYIPGEMLMKQAGYGNQLSELGQRNQLQTQDLLAQMALGQMTGNINLSNIMGNAFGNMVQGGSGLLSGFGSMIDDSGGLLDFGKEIYDRIFGD